VAAVVLAVVIVFATRRSEPRFVTPASHYDLYFSQGDQATGARPDVEQAIIGDVAIATERVFLATPGLDLMDLADVLVQAHERGVDVRVLEDGATQSDPEVAAVTERLQQGGIEPVLRQASGELAGTFIVVDRHISWVGSWELNHRGLEQDSQCVLRFDIPQIAENFATEFEEMFTDGAFGEHSTRGTPHSFLTILGADSINVYFTPEDQALEEVLQAIHSVQRNLGVMGRGLNMAALFDRLLAESRLDYVSVSGVFDALGPTPEDTLEILHKANMDLRLHYGTGQIGESAIIVDERVVILFSQPFTDSVLEQNDGYILVLWSGDMAKAFLEEFNRLYGLGQKWP
jgi:phosphatidylserine/phosphatidylglycerophosphate/cardiolipin synthase-like enzyme